MKKLLILSVFLATAAFAESKTVCVVPVLDTAAYATGDLIGTKLTFSNILPDGYFTGIIQNITITDVSGQTAPFELVLFNADPTGTTFTDQAAFDPADADLNKIIGVIPVSTFYAYADNGLAVATNLGLEVTGAARPLYAALVTRGAPDFVGASDVNVCISILAVEE